MPTLQSTTMVKRRMTLIATMTWKMIKKMMRVRMNVKVSRGMTKLTEGACLKVIKMTKKMKKMNRARSSLGSRSKIRENGTKK